MKPMVRYISCAFISAVLLLSAAAAQSEDTLILIAGQASRVKAQPWIDFLMKNGLAVEHYVLSELDKVKNQPYITIMGGLDEAGFRDLLSQAAGSELAASLEGKGAKKMLVKDDVWASGQKVLIFAGQDVDAAAAIRVETRDAWMECLTEWFDLEEIPGGLRAY
jgi:hypothetical protein